MWRNHKCQFSSAIFVFVPTSSDLRRLWNRTSAQARDLSFGIPAFLPGADSFSVSPVILLVSSTLSLARSLLRKKKKKKKKYHFIAWDAAKLPSIGVGARTRCKSRYFFLQRAWCRFESMTGDKIIPTIGFRKSKI